MIAEPVERWYSRRPLRDDALAAMKAEGGFREMREISPYENPEQSDRVAVGSRLAILMNNGLIGYYTVTAMSDSSGLHIVARDETGIQEKGRKFCIDSGMCEIYDMGYKVLEKFPWE